MPKFIGRNIKVAEETIDNLVREDYVSRGLVRLSFSQAVIAKNAGVKIYKSINTSDRGGPRSYAKRWYNWFVKAEDLIVIPEITKRMRELASEVITSNCIDAILPAKGLTT